ncbi:MAG TPA: DUF5615 family PIN-like protein [Polyangiaceae bacterium]|nr:DUF5615 family PIN-like protein [Polyangiaceae bacterium]
MRPKFHADECVDSRIVAGARRRDADAMTSEDAGLLGATDDRQLEFAIESGRVILTGDLRFAGYVIARMEAGLSIPGMIVITPRKPLGDAISLIALINESLDAREMVNQVEWV